MEFYLVISFAVFVIVSAVAALLFALIGKEKWANGF